MASPELLNEASHDDRYLQRNQKGVLKNGGLLMPVNPTYPGVYQEWHTLENLILII
jgi:hypothetical protein